MEHAEFLLLGPVEVRAGASKVAIGGAMSHRMLAALLLDANRVVSIEQIVDAAWGDRPPASARAQVQNRVSALRRILHKAQPGRELIGTSGSGYLIKIDDEQLDLTRFQRWVDDAADRAATGNRHAAVRLLTSALSLWRGPALDGLHTPYFQAAAQGLEEQRLNALEKRIELELELGPPGEVVAELVALVGALPFRERCRALLMLALARTGRRADALETFRAGRQILAEQLGLEPGRLLQRLHSVILRGDAELAGLSLRQLEEPASARRPPGATGSGPAAQSVPAQLPLAVRDFAGRGEALALLQAQPASTMLITGMGGVGKTSLALHWAHLARHRFPDGQLFLDLRGYDPVRPPVTPDEAIWSVLEALGVLPQHIPAARDNRISLYRSLLADKQILLVLDNARDAEQVRPLLPGDPACTTLITSRDRLSGLVATAGIRPLSLDVLTRAESRELFALRLGEDRLLAELDAAEEIIVRCGGLPLALAIVAARAVVQPHRPLATLAAELRQNPDSLDAFSVADPLTDMRAVFSWSYKQLGDPAGGLFRLLGLHPGPFVDAEAAASLAGVGPERVRPLLAELSQAHLLKEHRPGRYLMHDLLRTYAVELANHSGTEAERHAGRRRMFDHYTQTADRATRKVQWQPDRDPPPPAAPGAVIRDFGDDESALAWLHEQQPVLLALTDEALRTGFDPHAISLPAIIEEYLERNARWDAVVHTQQVALLAAQRMTDPAAEEYARKAIAGSLARLGEFDAALAHLRRALHLSQELGDTNRVAGNHRVTAWVLEFQGAFEEAKEHDRQALRLYRSIDDHSGVASTLNSIGWLSFRLGDYRSAIDPCRQALAIFEELGNRNGMAHTSHTLGVVHHRLGDQPSAQQSLRRALDLFRQIGDLYHAAITLNDLGDCAIAVGDPQSAHAAWQESLDILVGLDQPEAEEIREKLALHAGAHE